jgi:Zn-finger nucleic acid-binding protein
MSYRDRAIQCPRCGIELTRSDGRDRWRCVTCKGALFAVGEVVQELLATAPDLAPKKKGSTLSTLARRTVAPLLDCSVCGAPMEPVFLGGVDVDRCFHDELIWFDRGELALVVDVAADQHRERAQSWLVRLLAFWFIG